MNSIVLESRRQTPAIKSYRPGQALFEAGAAARLVFRIQTGWVRLQVTSAEGVRSVVAFLGPGDTLGAFNGTNVAAAECITSVNAVAYDSSDLARLQSTSPELAERLRSTEDRRYAALTDHVQDLLQRTAPQRALCLLAWISSRVRADGDTGLTRLPMSREDMADYLNVAPATLSRIMSQFQDEGRVRLDGPRNFAILAHPPFFRDCHAEERCGACKRLCERAEAHETRSVFNAASAVL
ncbi:MAG: Crp/Fnr family transcriptional regulator [Phenylobacterium sp.]